MQLKLIKYIDWKLIIITLLIVSLGLAILYSLTINQENPDYSRIIRQFTALGLGVVLALILMSTSYKVYSAIAWFLYVFANLLLILVLLFGRTIRGTTGWFNFLGLSFQPVELVKIILVITLAHFFSKYIQYRNNWKGWLLSFLIIIPPSLLSMLQPDFGPVLIFGSLWLVLVLLIQTNKKFIWWFIILVAVIGFVGWQFILSDYHLDRIQTFINPDLDPLGQGYNIKQSIIAVGSGKFFGRGLGLGTQSQLKFLPEATTDFIFAVIAEELGLLGVLVLLALFVLFFQRIYIAIQNTKDDFAQFLLIGFFTILFIQVVINIGMNLGLVPVAGLALPMISYGGSYLLVTCGVIGIISNIIIISKKSI